MDFLWFLIIGAVSGWIAGKLFTGSGFGLLGNIVVGIIGGIVGGWVAGLLGIGGGNIIWKIIISVVGAWILLFIIGLFSKKR